LPEYLRLLDRRIGIWNKSIESVERRPARDHESVNPLISKNDLEFGFYVSLFSACTIPDLKRRIDSIVQGLGFSDYSFIRVFEQPAIPVNLISMSTVVPERIHIGGLYGHDIVYPFDKSNVKSIFKSTVDSSVRWEACGFGLGFESGPQPARSSISLDCYDYYNVMVDACGSDACSKACCSDACSKACCSDACSKARCSDACTNACRAVLSVTQRGLTNAELNRKVTASHSTLQILCMAIDRVTVHRFQTLPVYTSLEKKLRQGEVPAPLHVLETLANSDMTIEQIADRFSVNRSDIQNQLKSIRREFGVRTNFAAIKQAVLVGLIEFD
jgi:DNA-binding CsgD family transcriptional regulator